MGNVYQILCKGIPAPQINCEVAVPPRTHGEALAVPQAWQEANPGVLHYPFILRCTGPSVAWLSAAHDKSVCWIGFLVHLAADGTSSGAPWSRCASCSNCWCRSAVFPIRQAPGDGPLRLPGPVAALARLPGPEAGA